MSKASLKGQVAWITGASQGIGATVAHHLAAQGIHLVLSARTAHKLEALEKELRDKHPDVEVLVAPLDVTDNYAVNTVAEKAIERFKKIDILINNAGVAGKIAMLHEVPVADVDNTINVNVKGAIYCMQAVLPGMIHHHQGVIINMNSVAGKTAYPYWSIYDASKFALHAITVAAAEEYRQNNIKVVGLYPGAVDTPIWNTIELDHEPNLNGMLDADTVAETILYVLQQPEKVHISEITLAPLKPAL